ncbi:MAG: PaaI family thioesterase [Pseudomonadota bacterium]
MSAQFPALADADPVGALNRMQQGYLPGELALEVLEVAHGHLRSQVKVEKRHMAPNGYMHAASVVALLDTAAGYGCRMALPPGASGFTTIEIKTNFLGTAKEGETVICEANLIHGGRTTQVWDAVATNRDTGKVMALFRCSQMVLRPN